MGTTSTLRTLVEDALADRNTTLADFIAKGRDEGKVMRTLAVDLSFVTGIPVNWRTLYRWAGQEEKAS